MHLLPHGMISMPRSIPSVLLHDLQFRVEHLEPGQGIPFSALPICKDRIFSVHLPVFVKRFITDLYNCNLIQFSDTV